MVLGIDPRRAIHFADMDKTCLVDRYQINLLQKLEFEFGILRDFPVPAIKYPDGYSGLPGGTCLVIFFAVSCVSSLQEHSQSSQRCQRKKLVSVHGF